MNDKLIIAGREFNSRLIIGTGKYRSNEQMTDAFARSGAEMITVAVRRVNITDRSQPSLLDFIDLKKFAILPNTAGCYSTEEAVRTARLARRLPAFLRDFATIWADREAEIDRWWHRLRGLDTATLSLPELADMLRSARRFHKRAFEIHFEIMYPLLVNYLGFHGACVDMGLDPSRTGVFLQGVDTRISQTDQQLWRLTQRARQAGLVALFAATEPADLAATCVREAVSRSGVDPADVGHSVFGNVIHTEHSDMYLGRVAALRGGLSIDTPAFTLNRLCGSGLQAIVSAASW